MTGLVGKKGGVLNSLFYKSQRNAAMSVIPPLAGIGFRNFVFPCSIFDIQPFHPDRSTSAAEGSFCDGFRVFMGKESSSFVIPCSVFDIQPFHPD
jgi:hypothetical protein